MLVSGINKEYLDTTVSPTVDFYQYACGGWMKMYPLKPEYSRYGSFDKLGEDNQLKLKELIMELAAAKNKQGSVAQKIGDFYNMGMDSAMLEKQGAEPIMPLLKEISQLDGVHTITKKIAELHLCGIHPFFAVF